MTELIPHAGLVHMPLALALLIPLMYVMAWFSVRKGWLNTNIWYGVAFFTLLQLLSIAMGLHSGEAAEFTSMGTHEAIEAHEEAAEKFLAVWISIGILMVGMLYARGKSWDWILDATIFALFGVELYLAFETGHLGGALL